MPLSTAAGSRAFGTSGPRPLLRKESRASGARARVRGRLEAGMSNETKQTLLWTGAGLVALIALLALAYALGFIGR